jgi:hypothetical protein
VPKSFVVELFLTKVNLGGVVEEPSSITSSFPAPQGVIKVEFGNGGVGGVVMRFTALAMQSQFVLIQFSKSSPGFLAVGVDDPLLGFLCLLPVDLSDPLQQDKCFLLRRERVLPWDPLKRFPFPDFLSPFPIFL